jgi:hypothetical protein
MFGFGVGYSWGSASMEIGPLKICETVIAPAQPVAHPVATADAA